MLRAVRTHPCPVTHPRVRSSLEAAEYFVLNLRRDVSGCAGFNPEISTGFVQTLSTRIKASAARDKAIAEGEIQ